MREPTYDQAFQALLLQAGDEERADALFGGSFQRAREAVPPFLVGSEFPGVYLEHPLSGEPFLDATVLLGPLGPGTRIASPAAGEHAAMLDFYAQAREEYHDVTCGFEIDTGKAAGEPRAADLYLAQDARMPGGWPLSFFGMFRGRPGSPLRVCGYLADAEREACAADPRRLAAGLDAAGFSAYDGAMLEQASALMAAAPVAVDFQFDVLPDGTLGPTFAIDVQFGIEGPKAVRASFEDGPGATVMGLLEGWGATDGRWRQAVRATFARALPVETCGGGTGRYAFTLMPQWVKARWTDGKLQTAKLYHLAHAGLLE